MDFSTERLYELTLFVGDAVDAPVSQKNIPSSIMKLSQRLPEVSSHELGLALEQLALQERANSKFQDADRALFLSQSLEQATHWKIGQYIAQQLNGKKMVDLTAGIGGDALQFAKARTLHSVVEYDSSIRAVLEFNLREYHDVMVLDSWDEVDWDEVSAAYLDPSRRDEKGNVLVSLEDWQPNLVEVIPLLLSKVDYLVIKISPAFRETDLALLPEGWSLEVISLEGQVKQGVLWYGFDRPDRIASMIVGDTVHQFSTESDSSSFKSQGGETENVFLPYAGIRRAGLEAEFIQNYSLSRIPGIPKLVQGHFQEHLDHFGRWYEYECSLEGSLGDLKRELKKRKIRQFDVIFLEKLTLDTTQIYRKTQLREGGERVVFFALGEKPRRYQMILAKRKRGS
jgi:hypothetical protein